MRSRSTEIIRIVALTLAVGLAAASPLFFPSMAEVVKVDTGAARQVERAAELALTRVEVGSDPVLKLAELAGFDLNPASLLKPAGDWWLRDDSQSVEQVASASPERGGERAP